MASDKDDSIKTVVTCEGNISDPDFPYRLSSLLARLRSLLFAGNKPFRVTNVEPWNSVRVTFNIPREAAYRLRLLAQAGDRVLRELGILSVQIEGDQVISLTIAGRFNEPQEILLQPVDDDRPTSSSNSSSFDLGSLEAAEATVATTGTSKGISQYLGQSSQGCAVGTLAMAGSTVASSSSSSGGPSEGYFPGPMAPPQAGFKSPNVVAPGSEPIPFPPKSGNPLMNHPHHLHHSPSRNLPSAFGPFPFASMTHAMNMHGSQSHNHPGSATSSSSTPAVASVSTTSSSSSASTSASSSPAPAAAATRFPFSPPTTSFPHPAPVVGSGGPCVSSTGAFQPVRHAFPSSSSASMAATVAAVAAGGGGVVLNNMARGHASDRANAALMSPLLVNLLQSDTSGPGLQQIPLIAGSTTAKTKSPALNTSSEPGVITPTKRKRKPRKSKEKLEGLPVTSSPQVPLLLTAATKTACASTSSTASVEPGSLITQQPVAAPNLSPPSLTPPSTSPPSLGPPFTDSAVASAVSASKIPPSSLSHSFVVSCQHQQVYHQQHHPLSHHHPPHHHRVPPLPSPPPTAPSSSASTSNNSGQSSQEAEHELSPWPSPAKRTQHLVNPFTGQLEPMSSEEEEEEEDEDFGVSSSVCDGAPTSSNEGPATPLLESASSSSSSSSSMRFDLPDRGRVALSTAESRRPPPPPLPEGREQQTSATPVGSPGEKIKLRLKLDPKEGRPRAVPDKPKPKIDVALAASQYKVDVSFVNIPTRRMSGSTLSASASATTAVGGGAKGDTTPPAASGSSSFGNRSGSPTGSLCYGIAGGLSTTPEPRVPPLHISLRGRNATVVTSPRRGEKLRARPREPGDCATRGMPASSKGVKGKSARGALNASAASAAASATDGTVPFRGLAGHRTLSSRGAGHSRRGRGAQNSLSSVLPSRPPSRVAVSVMETESPSQLPGRPVNRSGTPVEVPRSVSPTQKDRSSASPPGMSQHPGWREHTLLSGGSMVLNSSFPCPPTTATSSSGTPTTTCSAAQPQQTLQHTSKNVAAVAATAAAAPTVVSSVQIPRRGSDSSGQEKARTTTAPKTPENLPHGLPRRRPSLHERALTTSATVPIHRLHSGLVGALEGGEGGVPRPKDTLRVAADVGAAKERSDVLKTRFGIKVKNIGQHHRGLLTEHQGRAASTAPGVPVLVESRERPTTMDVATVPKSLPPPTTPALAGAGELVSTEQQRIRMEERHQPLVVRGVKVVPLSEVSTHVSDVGGVSLDTCRLSAAVLSQRTTGEIATPMPEVGSPMVRQVKCESPKITANPLQPLGVSAAEAANYPESANRCSQSALEKYYQQHLRHLPHLVARSGLAVDKTKADWEPAVLPTVPVARLGTTTVVREQSLISDGDGADSRLVPPTPVREPRRELPQLGDSKSRTSGTIERIAVPSDTASSADRPPDLTLRLQSSVDDQQSLVKSACLPRDVSVPFSARVAAPDVPFSCAAQVTLIRNGEQERVGSDGLEGALATRSRERAPSISKCASESRRDGASIIGDAPHPVENCVHIPGDTHSAIDENDIVEAPAVSPTNRTAIAEDVVVEVPCGDGVPPATTVTPPLSSQLSRPIPRVGAPMLAQDKLRLVGALVPAVQLVSTGSMDGDVLLQGVVQLDEDEAEFAGEVAMHRRHHHHHILNSAATPSTAVSIVTVSSSPCSASPSGSSPDSLNAGTSSEDNGDHVAPVRRSNGGGRMGGGGVGIGERHRRIHPGSQCNSSGSPYEDSGIESMDATALEKLPGNDSPSDGSEANSLADQGGGQRPAPQLPPPPDPPCCSTVETSLVINNRRTPNTPIDEVQLGGEGGTIRGITTSASLSVAVSKKTESGTVCPPQDGGHPPYKEEAQNPEFGQTSFACPNVQGLNAQVMEACRSEETKISPKERGIVQKDTLDSAESSPGNGNSRSLQVGLGHTDAQPFLTNETPAIQSSLFRDRATEPSVSVWETPEAAPPITDALAAGNCGPLFLSRGGSNAAQEGIIGGGFLDEGDDDSRQSIVLELPDSRGTPLLASVVFRDGEGSLDLVSSFESGALDSVALGEEDLACVSPSGETTTQLLVFTVDDVNSIVMTDHNSSDGMSLLEVTHPDTPDFVRRDSTAVQFSALSDDHLAAASEMSNSIRAIEAHLQEGDCLPLGSYSIDKTFQHLDNCIDVKEDGCTAVQLQLPQADRVGETSDGRSTVQSSELPDEVNWVNHTILSDNGQPSESQVERSPTTICANAVADGCSPTESVICGSGGDVTSSVPIKFVSISSDGTVSRTQMMTTSSCVGGSGHGSGGVSENGEVAVSMPPAAGSLFQSVSPVKLVMSRLCHPSCSASCTSPTVTLTTVLVKSQGAQNQSPAACTVSGGLQHQPVGTTATAQLTMALQHHVPNLVPLNALSPGCVAAASTTPPLVKLALSGGSARAVFCSPDSVPVSTLASYAVACPAPSPPSSSAGIPITNYAAHGSVHPDPIVADATPVKTQSLTGSTYSVPVTSCAPTRIRTPPLTNSCDANVSHYGEGGSRRRGSTDSDSDTSGSMLSGASCDGGYRRPHRGSKDGEEEEGEEDDDGSYAGNISITSGDHNYIFRASRPTAASRDRARELRPTPSSSSSNVADVIPTTTTTAVITTTIAVVAVGDDNSNGGAGAADVTSVRAPRNSDDQIDRCEESQPTVQNDCTLIEGQAESDSINVATAEDSHIEAVSDLSDSRQCYEGVVDKDVVHDTVCVGSDDALNEVVTGEAEDDPAEGPVATPDVDGVYTILKNENESSLNVVAIEVFDNEVTTTNATVTTAEVKDIPKAEEVVPLVYESSIDTENSSNLDGEEPGRKLEGLTIEIPPDLEVGAEVERRSTRSTRSSSRIASPGNSRSACSPELNSHASAQGSMAAAPAANHNIDSDVTPHEFAVRTLPSRGAAKRKREDSDSDSERRTALALSAAGPLTPVSLDIEGGPALDSTTDVEDCPAKGQPTTDAVANQFFTKPVKRKCSENAVELIKVSLGVDDNPKRATSAKLPPSSGGENARVNSNRSLKAVKDAGSKLKGQHSASGVSEESSDDEVSLSELVTKVRSSKGRQGASHVEDRSITRNAKQRQSAREEEEAVTTAVSLNATAKACRTNSRRDDGRTTRTPGGGGPAASQRDSRKEERIGARLSGRIVSDKNRRVATPPPPTTKASEKLNHRAKAKDQERPTSPSHGSGKEEPDGKRKLRSSGSSGYYDSLPQKRRRFSRDHR